MLGKYIVFEGGEYTGKSTQALELAQDLGAVLVREPGGTPVGESIRSTLLDPNNDKAAATQVLLFAAQRAELARTIINPALENGQHVVSDRSWLSSAVYQTELGEDFDDIKAINRYAIGSLLQPDLCIVLDGDPDKLKKRVPHKPGDFYENMDTSFHCALRERFLDMSKYVLSVIIDAERSKSTVKKDVRQTVRQRLEI